MALVYVSSRYNQHRQIFSFPLPSLPWSMGHIVASLFLVRDIGGYPFIDGIVWTLEIEIKFYLLCCIARTWLVEKPVKFVLLIIVLAALSFVLMKCKSLIEINFIERLVQIFFKTMKFVCFMGLGCFLSYVHQKKITARKAFMYSLILAMLYFEYFIDAKNYAVQWKEIASYGLAYLLFIGCYALKGKIPNQGVMAHIGKTSYSLYLVHGVPGFIMMYWMINQRIHPVVAIVTAFFCLLLMASVFYLLIEINIVQLLTTKEINK
jgi:peptidoglycan/LPS O-acetylase OafA/YrhL